MTRILYYVGILLLPQFLQSSPVDDYYWKQLNPKGQLAQEAVSIIWEGGDMRKEFLRNGFKGCSDVILEDIVQTEWYNYEA